MLFRSISAVSAVSTVNDYDCTRGKCCKDDWSRPVPMNEPLPCGASRELSLVREWLRAQDIQDLERMKRLTSPDCMFYYLDCDSELPAREFWEAMERLYASFPDLHFYWKSIQEVSPGVIVVDDLYGAGHHTGKPYAVGPYPEIAASHLHVKDDPFRFTVLVRNGKISQAKICGFGKPVGPTGYYSKIGGVLFL